MSGEHPQPHPPHDPLVLQPEHVKPREAKRLFKQWRKLLKRKESKLGQHQIFELRLALDNLSRALEDKHQARINEAVFNCDRRFEQHLGFAQKSPLREYTESIFLAIIFALLLRAFVVEAFKIPTKSMVPTLLKGDHLFVNKFAYGLRLPFTTRRIIDLGLPDYGDVIVFIFPRESARQHLESMQDPTALLPRTSCIDQKSLLEEKDYIKRVIGLPGDTVQVIDNVIHINDQPIKRTVLYERSVTDYMAADREIESWSEEELFGRHYITISRHSASTTSGSSTFGPITVEDHHVFVMGDNRDNSSDSRCWGQVPVENIKGKAFIIWWSHGETGTRWSRLLTLIQ